MSSEVDAVLVLQSSKLLHEARCVSLLYAAIQQQVPVIPINLTSDNSITRSVVCYDFEAARSMMHDLSKHMHPRAIDAIQVTTSATAEAVGAELGDFLPNIISKPLALHATVSEVNAQMEDVVSTVRNAVHSTKDPDAPPVKISEGVPPSGGAAGSDSDDDCEEMEEAEVVRSCFKIL